MDDKERIRNSAKIYGVGVYARILENARTNLRALLGKRQEIDEQTRSLQRITNTVLAVCEEDGVLLPFDLLLPFDEDVLLSLSLIDAVRAVLKQHGDFMTVAEVRDRLVAMELDLHKLWNPTALVRKTLKRPLERGEVSGAPEGKPVRYKWLDPAGKAQKPDPPPTILRTGTTISRTPRDEGTGKPLHSEPSSRRIGKLEILRAFLRSGAS
jgi:hypothetical protein